jgi:hypothetical protein
MGETKYTYEKPDDQAFHKTLVGYLEYKGERPLAKLLSVAKCNIVTTSSFSYKRWNTYRAGVRFYVPVTTLKKLPRKASQKLIPFCQEVMPADAGYEIMEVEFSPLIESAETIDTAVAQVDETVGGLSREVTAAILPADIMQKGKEMAALYVYLYVIENALRLFIEIVAKNRYKDQYIKKLKIPQSMRQKISLRKSEAATKRWLPSRGDSDLFYVDFDDLGGIIQSNWMLFKDYFPKQNWITGKVSELSDCRHLVAHNSYLEEPQRNLVKVYYTNILMQLNSSMKDLVATTRS